MIYLLSNIISGIIQYRFYLLNHSRYFVIYDFDTVRHQVHPSLHSEMENML